MSQSEKGHLPIPETRWPFVPCSRDVQDKAQSGFPKRQPHGQGMWENVNVMERYHGKNSSGCSKKQIELTPCQILGKLISQTEKKKEMMFAGRRNRR